MGFEQLHHDEPKINKVENPPVDPGVSEKKKTGNEYASKIKITLNAITAALMLLSATPAFAEQKAENLNESQKIELQIQKLKEQQRVLENKERQERHDQKLENFKTILDSFKVKGLSLGKPNFDSRHYEEHGIYIDSKYIGDIRNPGHAMSFLEDGSDFKIEVEKLLREKGIYSKEAIKEKIPFNIEPDAQMIMNKWGWKIKGEKIDFGSRTQELDLNGDGGGGTKDIDISVINDGVIFIMVENMDGTFDTVYGVNGKILQEFK
ncbi:MAG: hypothetical protein AAB693_01535 [Patescibacteria group bacterium]|mgnify:CR=1 FL=1